VVYKSFFSYEKVSFDGLSEIVLTIGTFQIYILS
jgi:hypothetical protein